MSEVWVGFYTNTSHTFSWAGYVAPVLRQHKLQQLSSLLSSFDDSRTWLPNSMSKLQHAHHCWGWFLKYVYNYLGVRIVFPFLLHVTNSYNGSNKLTKFIVNCGSIIISLMTKKDKFLQMSVHFYFNPTYCNLFLTV